MSLIEGLVQGVTTNDWRTSAYEKYGLSDDKPFPLTGAEVPVTLCSLFLLLCIAGEPKENGKRRDIGMLRYLFHIYNVTMTYFSGKTFLTVYPLVRDAWQSGLGPADIVCVVGRDHWDTVGFLSWLFYLSKFYEFMDTINVIVRNRRPSFLQYFHHCGAPLMMWALLVTKSPAIVTFVVPNSFIHTGMYFYYTVTGFGLRVPKPLKMLVTVSQVVQIGYILTLLRDVSYVPGCQTDGQLVSGVLFGFYAAIVEVLFLHFMYHSYYRTRSKKA